jgi:hypothetical protein
MQGNAQLTESIGLQRRQGQCGMRSKAWGVPGFVPEHLELGDVGDVLDTRGIAQASNKLGELVAKSVGDRAAWRMAEDEATRDDTKRQLTDQPTNDGIAGGQEFNWA